MTTNLLIVDDHPMFLNGIITAIDAGKLVSEIFSATSVTAALDVLEQQQIALILTDLQMPDQSGEDLIRKVCSSHSNLPILIVSATDSTNRIAEALRAGARGFVSKTAGSSALLEALTTCLEGGSYIPPELAQEIDKYLARQAELKITKRQREIVKLMSMGFANKKIAYDLHISETTVKTHVSALFQAFGVFNRLDCVRKAEEMGVLE